MYLDLRPGSKSTARRVKKVSVLTWCRIKAVWSYAADRSDDDEGSASDDLEHVHGRRQCEEINHRQDPHESDHSEELTKIPLLYVTPVFINLFFEAEPFAAILIAHRIHENMEECVLEFMGHSALLRREGPKFEVEGKKRGKGFLERVARSLPTILGSLGSAVRSSRGFRGGAPAASAFWTN